MKIRLSSKQREVLQMVADSCVPTAVRPNGPDMVIPLYVEHIPEHLFWSQSERDRFVKNLESRGLISVKKQHFLYITDAGKSALAANTSYPTEGLD